MKTLLILAALMLLPIATPQAANAAPESPAGIQSPAPAQKNPQADIATATLFAVDGVIASITPASLVIAPIDNHVGMTFVLETGCVAATPANYTDDDVWKVTVPEPGDTVNNGHAVYVMKADAGIAIGGSIIGNVLNEGANGHIDTADPAVVTVRS